MRTYTITQSEATTVITFPYTFEPTPTIIRTALESAPGIISVEFHTELEPTATGTITIDSTYIEEVCAVLSEMEDCDFVYE